MSTNGNGSHTRSSKSARSCADCGRKLPPPACDFFLNANTGFCRQCGQKRLAFATRAPEARRWIASWQDKLARAIEAAELPQDAKLRLD